MTSFSTASSPPIKSIQRGTVSVARNTSSTVAINSVDVTKTFISATCEDGSAIGINGASFYAGALSSNVVLTNATTLTVSTGELYIGILYVEYPPVLSWEVIEYA